MDAALQRRAGRGQPVRLAIETAGDWRLEKGRRSAEVKGEWRAGDSRPTALHGGPSCRVLHPRSPSHGYRRPSAGKDPTQSHRGPVHPAWAPGLSSVCGSGRCAGDARGLHLPRHAPAVAPHHFV